MSLQIPNNDDQAYAKCQMGLLNDRHPGGMGACLLE
jgi:hypothetical protein